MNKLQTKEGTILILAIWALGLLGILTLNIGVQIRQKMKLVSRLEQRQDLYWLAKAGIQKAMYVFYESHKSSTEGQSLPPARQRVQWLNNPTSFKDVRFGRGTFELKYHSYDISTGLPRILFGFSDEERRININKVDEAMLTKLIQTVLVVEDEEAKDLAQAVIDWRRYGESEIVGFYSDEYYDTLEFPFPEKKANFENIHELALLKGWTKEICSILMPFLTVYGEGQVNVNTAAPTVLIALGLSDDFVNNFISIRRGVDSLEWTADDVVFEDLSQMVAFMTAQKAIEKEDIQRLNDLISRDWLGTQSYYYRIHSHATLSSSQDEKVVSCIFFAPDQKIVYWKES